jgi:hypothetical protein
MLSVTNVCVVTDVLVVSCMVAVAMAGHGVVVVIRHGTLYVGSVICMATTALAFIVATDPELDDSNSLLRYLLSLLRYLLYSIDFRTTGSPLSSVIGASLSP